jgi:hypothetical protein
MSTFAGTNWNAGPKAVAAELPFSACFEDESMRDKLAAIRDTLIVIGLQVVFRAAMLLRRWNY